MKRRQFLLTLVSAVASAVVPGLASQEVAAAPELKHLRTNKWVKPPGDADSLVQYAVLFCFSDVRVPQRMTRGLRKQVDLEIEHMLAELNAVEARPREYHYIPAMATREDPLAQRGWAGAKFYVRKGGPVSYREKVIIVLLVLITYAAVCSIVYRFRNPELTETQLLLGLPKALMWWRQ